MATHAIIGKVKDNGEIKAIYCHYDGYEDGVGNTLRAHYLDEEKVDELLDLGAISSLGEKVDQSPLVKKYGLFWYANEEARKQYTREERMDMMEEDTVYTKAYHRDNGEPKKIITEKNKRILKNKYKIFYIYLFEDGKWKSVHN